MLKKAARDIKYYLIKNAQSVDEVKDMINRWSGSLGVDPKKLLINVVENKNFPSNGFSNSDVLSDNMMSDIKNKYQFLPDDVLMKLKNTATNSLTFNVNPDDKDVSAETLINHELAHQVFDKAINRLKILSNLKEILRETAANTLGYANQIRHTLNTDPSGYIDSMKTYLSDFGNLSKLLPGGIASLSQYSDKAKDYLIDKFGPDNTPGQMIANAINGTEPAFAAIEKVISDNLANENAVGQIMDSWKK